MLVSCNEQILNLKLIIPTDEKIKDFEKTVGSLILKKEINYNQIQTLKQTRDTLLPKLMSGQLRVDEFKERAVV
jgi:type I restriction enzyme S subunit